MKIRWKISIVVAALFAVLAVSEIFIAQAVFMPSFSALERQEADVAMRRVDFAVDRTFDQLAQAARSWGNWSDTYQFVLDRNRNFVDVNVTPVGLKESVAEVAIVEDLSGRILAAAAFDLASGRPLDLALARAQTFDPPFPSRDALVNGRTATGLLRTERGVLMLAASPILNGVGGGPARGSVVMGRFLSKEEVSRMGEQAQAKLSISVPDAGSIHPRIVTTEEVTKISETLKDIYGAPIVTLHVDLPRDITERGRSAVHYASLYLIGAAVVVVIVLALILNRVVLNPLARMTRHAVEIGKSEDLTTRLNFNGYDEIGVLAREFDRMVARVAESRAQLVDQSFKAGFAELAKGVLHNLGNAMTPIGVRLAILRTRLHSIALEDFELAATELAGGKIDPARRADLEEFVRLSCSQLTGTLEAAGQDVDLMLRQAALVQGALTEQIRTTGNEHVMESVRLADLLGQALDVVPDAARQIVEIHADPSLDEVGVVHVPRTVLGLVLQNFVINAADAIRETGKGRGSLRIAAQISGPADARQLLIRCSDNGIGIAAENLQRVFEKGFSTKSKETNFGIGLHWCANAIGALGGRVWATSEGVGHGATLHVAIPLRASDSVAMTQAA